MLYVGQRLIRAYICMIVVFNHADFRSNLFIYLFIQNFSVFFIKKMAADSILVTNLVLQIKGGMMAIFIFRYTFE
jgi:hypothetical protein